MQRVLVVDDEVAIRRALGTNLRARGYTVDTAETGEHAIQLAARLHPDLIIVDLGLPGTDGITVIRSLRTWTSTPIVVLSARSTEPDMVAALDAGADDYVAKPFGMSELLARVRAALRRGSPTRASQTIVTNHFTIDFLAKQVTEPDGTVIRLTPTEWHLVERLALNAGKLVTPRQLLEEIWGPQYAEASNYIRVHLANLRRKLEPTPSRPRYFITEPGMGYRFEPPDEREVPEAPG